MTGRALMMGERMSEMGESMSEMGGSVSEMVKMCEEPRAKEQMHKLAGENLGSKTSRKSGQQISAKDVTLN